MLFLLPHCVFRRKSGVTQTTGANHSNSAAPQPVACCYILISMLNCFFSITSVVSSTSADNSQNIRCCGRCAQWARRPMRHTILLRRIYIYFLNKLSPSRLRYNWVQNFHFKQCLEVGIKLAKFFQLICTFKRTIFKKVRTETMFEKKIYICIFFQCLTCPCGLRGLPSWAWQKCKLLLRLGRP